MIRLIIGPGGHYVDIGDFLNSIAAIGPLPDSYYCKINGNITNNTFCGAYGTISLNGHIVVIDFCGYTVTSTDSIYLYLHPVANYTGTFKMVNGKLIMTPAAANLITVYTRADIGQDTQMVCFENLKIFANNDGLVFNIVPQSTYYYLRLLNLLIYNPNPGLFNIGIYIRGRSPSGGPRPDFIGIIADNIIVYSSVVGIQAQFTPYVAYKNVISWGSTITMDWSVFTTNSTFINCADSDGSLLWGTNTYHGVVANDFISVDQNDPDFNRVKNGVFSCQSIVNPHQGKAPLNVLFRANPSYDYPSPIAYSGTSSDYVKNDLDGNLYGKYAVFPIGCYNAEITV